MTLPLGGDLKPVNKSGLRLGMIKLSCSNFFTSFNPTTLFKTACMSKPTNALKIDRRLLI